MATPSQGVTSSAQAIGPTPKLYGAWAKIKKKDLPVGDVASLACVQAGTSSSSAASTTGYSKSPPAPQEGTSSSSAASTASNSKSPPTLQAGASASSSTTTAVGSVSQWRWPKRNHAHFLFPSSQKSVSSGGVPKHQEESAPFQAPLKASETAASSASAVSDPKAAENGIKDTKGTQPKRIKRILDVHKDDIHCLVRLGDETFVSGSKDGSLKKWDLRGTLVKSVYDYPTTYQSWVTCLARLDDTYWLSGTRDGYIDLWETSGQWARTVSAASAAPDVTNVHKCKGRNFKRVNCLTGLKSSAESHHFIAGWPTQFTLHDLEGDTTITSCKTSVNDWVYVVYPLSERKLLVVTGAEMSIWEENQGTSVWACTTPLVGEQASEGPRPYISAVTPLTSYPNCFGLSVFDGSCVIYDLEVQKCVTRVQEHVDRVWTIENIGRSHFASCGDDGFIKIWDIRASKASLFTLQDNLKEKARVSVLLAIDEHRLLSGACPDKPHKSPTKATFSFWDLRL